MLWHLPALPIGRMPQEWAWWLFSVHHRPHTRDKFTPCCSEVISHLYLCLDVSHSFPRATWMDHLGIISFLWSKSSGFNSGCLATCFLIEKIGFLFPGNVSKISKCKCIGQANHSCQKQTNSKIVWAPIKISSKSTRIVLLSNLLYWRSLARKILQCISEFMYVCMKHLISTYSEVWRLFYITVSGWGWDPRSVLKNTWTAVMRFF